VNVKHEDDVVEATESSHDRNGETKEKKSFDFTGEVLYIVRAVTAEDSAALFLNYLQGEGRRFFKQATLAGLLETISIGDVCWLAFLSFAMDSSAYGFFIGS
jgi:hypothetical protein